MVQPTMLGHDETDGTWSTESDTHHIDDDMSDSLNDESDKQTAREESISKKKRLETLRTLAEKRGLLKTKNVNEPHGGPGMRETNTQSLQKLENADVAMTLAEDLPKHSINISEVKSHSLSLLKSQANHLHDLMKNASGSLKRDPYQLKTADQVMTTCLAAKNLIETLKLYKEIAEMEDTIDVSNTRTPKEIVRVEQNSKVSHS